VHLAVGDDVQAGALLIVDDRPRRVLVGLEVLVELERVEQMPSEQLVSVPERAWIRADHGGRQQRVNDSPRHCPVLPLVGFARRALLSWKHPVATVATLTEHV
jgi:hypothetical protein